MTDRTAHPTVSRARVRATGAAAGAALGGLLAAVAVLVSPANAALPVPVSCSDNVVLDHDDLTYHLQGTCGVVVITADNVVVELPATQKLVVRGQGNTVHGKTVDTMVVRGSDQRVDAASVRDLTVASSARSLVDTEGLVEDALLKGRGGDLAARQVSDLVVTGRGHDVAARRGYDARVPGDRNQVRFRRLDSVVVGGDHNHVVVRTRATRVRNHGDDNTITVHRRR